MFCSRQTNNMMNKLHERALRLVLNDHVSNLEALLRKNNDVSCHHRNIQVLMIELYKIKNELAPPVMNSMLNKRNITYNFRNLQEFHSERKRIVFNGLEAQGYRAPQLWALLPEEIKQRNTINHFKNDVKQCICKECPCRLCNKPRIYLTYGSYLGTIYYLKNYFFLSKLYMIHLTDKSASQACGSFHVNIITIIFSGVPLSFCI